MVLASRQTVNPHAVPAMILLLADALGLDKAIALAVYRAADQDS